MITYIPAAFISMLYSYATASVVHLVMGPIIVSLIYVIILLMTFLPLFNASTTFVVPSTSRALQHVKQPC